MAWLDDRIRDHPKLVGLSAAAFRHWIFVLCYCSEHGTRGNVDAAIIALRVPKATVNELVERSLWEQRDDGTWIHDWDSHNLKRDQARADKRSFDRRRQQLFRDPELRLIVRERDHDLCRYCGIEVNWHDRRGPTGATYDHVDPQGENTVENLVVSCRGCNSQKAGRTPEQARMHLRPVPAADLSPRSKSGSRSEPGDTSRARAGDRTNDHDHVHEDQKKDLAAAAPLTPSAPPERDTPEPNLRDAQADAAAAETIDRLQALGIDPATVTSLEHAAAWLDLAETEARDNPAGYALTGIRTGQPPSPRRGEPDAGKTRASEVPDYEAKARVLFERTGDRERVADWLAGLTRLSPPEKDRIMAAVAGAGSVDDDEPDLAAA